MTRTASTKRKPTTRARTASGGRSTKKPIHRQRNYGSPAPLSFAGGIPPAAKRDVRGAIFGGELPVNLGTITAYARRIYGRRTKWTCETVPSAACDPHGVACNLYRVLDDSGGERFILQVKGATSHEAMRAALGALMGIEIERRRVAKVRA